MKVLKFLRPATLLIAGMLATVSGADAASAQSAPAVAPAANCWIGIGVGLNQVGLTPDEHKNLNGVTISFLKPLTVMTVLPGTPAQAAHIYRGDIIIKVDGKLVRGMTLPQASARISNGPPGSTVSITIRRDGNHIQRDITLTRAQVCSTTP